MQNKNNSHLFKRLVFIQTKTFPLPLNQTAINASMIKGDPNAMHVELTLHTRANQVLKKVNILTFIGCSAHNRGM